MRQAIYIESFEGPDAVPFTTGMRMCIIQMAPPAYYGPLLPVPSNLVGSTSQEATRAFVHLGKIELARQKWGPAGPAGRERVDCGCAGGK